MTHDEMIAVIQAHKEGKVIWGRKIGGKEWITTGKPIWNFDEYDYRIKPEEAKPHYRPFKNAEEVMEAIKEHGDWLRRIEDKIYLKLTVIDAGFIRYGQTQVRAFEDALSTLTFADGTPFGVKED